MRHSILSLFPAALLTLVPSLVSAHGYVEKAIIGGAEYSGFLPFYDPYVYPKRSLIFRPIVSNFPVEDLTLIDLQCGGYTVENIIGSSPAAAHAVAPAGSEISLTWTKWPDSHKGPLITYMAKCPGLCSEWLPGNETVWFKIHEIGKYPNGTWEIAKLEVEPVPAFKFNIPASLAPGNYIVRHEILALHGAFNYPGIQSYPSCFQITVTGSGTAVPPPSSLVAFPGAYNPSTPGIVFDMYSDPLLPYPFPGPPVWPGAPPPAVTTTSTSTSTTSTTTSSSVNTSTTVSTSIIRNTTRSTKKTTSTSKSTSTTRTTTKTSTTTRTSPTPIIEPIPRSGQCGGIGYTGIKLCPSDQTCTRINDYYYQCL